MKNLTCFILTLVACNCAFAADLDSITQNVKSVCQSPSLAGEYWSFSATGRLNGEGTVSVISAGIKAEAIFSEGEWEGVQQVLKNQQSADNANYRSCVKKITPLFLKKFLDPPQRAKHAGNTKHKAPAAESAKTTGIHQETKGDKSPAIVSDHDVTINYH